MEQVFASHHLMAGIGFKAATASHCIRRFHRPREIHPAIHSSSPHMQPCLEDLQVQRSSYPHCQPDYTSSPEPGPEPMQLDTTQLTFAEWQNRLTQGLCIYCGAGGHAIATCPVRPPRPTVSVVHSVSVNMRIPSLVSSWGARG